MHNPFLSRAGITLATLAISAAGGSVLFVLSVPAAWLTGGVLAVAAAEFRGFRSYVPDWLRQIGYFVLGSSLGASISPDTLGRVGSWPLSIAALVLSVIAAQLAGQAWLRHRSGWSGPTAFFASIPGSMNFVMAAADRSDADIRLVAIAQTVRLLVLVVLLPSVVALFDPPAGAVAPPPPLSPRDALELGAMAVAGALLFRLLRIPTPMLLGTLFASLLAYGSGLVTGALPRPVVIVATVVLATSIGSRFRGIDMQLMRAASLSAAMSFTVSLSVALGFALGLSFLVEVPIESLIVSFAPGSLDTMLIVAVSLHLDTAFVAAHHLVRFLGISFSLPLFVALSGGSPRRGAGE